MRDTVPVSSDVWFFLAGDIATLIARAVDKAERRPYRFSQQDSVPFNGTTMNCPSGEPRLRRRSGQ
jgi:hypothetical protein